MGIASADGSWGKEKNTKHAPHGGAISDCGAGDGEGKTMKTLILTVSTGWGHTATAMAIEARLRQNGRWRPTPSMCTNTSTASFRKHLDKSTALYTKVAPDIYRLVYDYLEGGVEVDQRNVFLPGQSSCAPTKLARLVEDYDPGCAGVHPLCLPPSWPMS